MIKNRQDFVFGIAAICIGGGFALGARDYRIGTALRMGAGYFPFYVGCLLALLGLWITMRALGGPRDVAGDIEPLPLRAIGFVLGANLAFGVLLVGLPVVGLPPMGLLAAVFSTVFLASMASEQFDYIETILLAILMCVLCYVLFVRGLGLNLTVFPALSSV